MIARREALRLLTAGSAVSALGIAATVTASCQPIPVAAASPDPLLAAVRGLENARAAYSALPEPLARHDEQEFCKAVYWPSYDALFQEPPMPTTMAGAIAALQFIAHDGEMEDTDHAAVLRTVLAFLKGRP